MKYKGNIKFLLEFNKNYVLHKIAKLCNDKKLRKKEGNKNEKNNNKFNNFSSSFNDYGRF